MLSEVLAWNKRALFLPASSSGLVPPNVFNDLLFLFRENTKGCWGRPQETNCVERNNRTISPGISLLKRQLEGLKENRRIRTISNLIMDRLAAKGTRMGSMVGLFGVK
ncbi:hypothetical protein TNIN_167911 [Trichonephila inaurata madagascariensis]|uniref:Uncharacterized protein n=1 Tax=Trichonephila inaurata madagascariensis TaxID=2747483 RepID=A0A8X6ISL7_9ARAC|nr:hypothetical protein TNIN_167911 [Trichonephila inaurata madagascariensis]